MKVKLLKMFLIIAIIFSIFSINYVQADVGSFETYDSDWGGSSWDSDWGSSSWDSDWSSSSSWDSDWDSDYDDIGGLLLLANMNPGAFIIFIIFMIIVITAIRKNPKNWQYPHIHRRPYEPPSREKVVNEPIINEGLVEQQVKEVDELFNKEEFISWAKTLFVKLQNAWTDRDWSVIRPFESNELFEQHKAQLDGYIRNKTINVMDRICVNYAKLYSFYQSGDKDVLIILLNSRMADYIINEETKEVVKGDKETERVNTYKMTFIRKTGVKTKPGSSELNTANCPNCGAPTQITSAGKCEYCNSVVTTGEFSWVLNNLERYT